MPMPLALRDLDAFMRLGVRAQVRHRRIQRVAADRVDDAIVELLVERTAARPAPAHAGFR